MPATAATSSDLVRSTRQQLDELDALLERMLELPVDSDGEGSPPRSTRFPIPSTERRVESPTGEQGETEAVPRLAPKWTRAERNITGHRMPRKATTRNGFLSKALGNRRHRRGGPLAKSWREANGPDETHQNRQGDKETRRQGENLPVPQDSRCPCKGNATPFARWGRG